MNQPNPDSDSLDNPPLPEFYPDSYFSQKKEFP